jgi:hypothetical protein
VDNGRRYSLAQRAQCITPHTDGHQWRYIEKKTGIPQSTQSKVKKEHTSVVFNLIKILKSSIITLWMANIQAGLKLLRLRQKNSYLRMSKPIESVERNLARSLLINMKLVVRLLSEFSISMALQTSNLRGNLALILLKEQRALRFALTIKNEA